MVINTNLMSISSANALSQSSSMLSKSLQRLSTGSKINSPSDDPAGLAVSMGFSAQINRVQAATNNVSNANSFSQTQDGFLQQVNDALNRMSELAVSAQDPTETNADRANYQAEFSTLQSYITDVGSKDFNGVSLFGAQGLQITTDGDTGKYTMNAVDLAVGTTYATATAATTKVDTTDDAAAALTAVKNAIAQLASDRGQIGANMSRLSMTSNQLGILNQNLQAANSQITDVDVATESANFARYNILVQAGTAMLAQANAAPQAALKLLQ